MVVVMPAQAKTGSDDVIEVDWYPLFTDSVGWNIYSGEFLLGWVNAPRAHEVNMGRSLELAWLNVAGVKYNTGHGLRITAGVGIDWRNYRLDEGMCFQEEGENISIAPLPEQAKGGRSRLKVFSITLPVLLRQRIVDKVDIFAGPVLNFNVHGSIKTTYKLNDEKVSVSSTRVHQVPVTVDVMGGIKWSCVGAYVRYSPCHVLKTEHAPEFTSLSAGIFLGF